MQCPSCHKEFDPSESIAACASCAGKGSCGRIRCPHCGNETVREPNILQKIRNLFPVRKKKSPVHPGQLKKAKLLLSDLKQGQNAMIEAFEDLAHVRKFLSLGILPGTPVHVVKRFPAVVLRSGYSEFAFDRRLAKTVRVQLIEDK
ncbi:TPA: hypothetical protein DDW35_08580 [Candidatus Sumerlaeota bacterium]|jgi:Fe2+ transport system protein FeoA|nr:hypothetical protein [Candidatus Sumerlaeota bacterium]